MVKFERNPRIDDILGNLKRAGIEEASDFNFIAVIYNEILNFSELEIEAMLTQFGIGRPIGNLKDVALKMNVKFEDAIDAGVGAYDKLVNNLKKKYVK